MAVEGFVLDGLDLQAGSYILSELRFTPARKRPDWAQSSDSDGALLVRDPLYENSQWDAVVVVDAASRDAAHTAVGLVTDKLEEAERNQLGIPLVWTPADSTKALTFYVLTGEISEIPIDWESGYFASAPRLQLHLSLTCRPFGYGAEETVASAAGSGPVQYFLLPNVKGDVPAEARLIVSDTATQSRDFAAWGLEWRFQAGADLLLTQNELTNSGLAGTSTTRSGSVSTNVYRGTLLTSAIAICSTGNQPHVGSFRPYLRCYPTTTDVQVRLSYQVGDGPFKALNWEAAVEPNQWNEIDLGVVSIPPKVLGTQRWVGLVEAYSATEGDTVDVDYLILMPADYGFGRARRPGATDAPSSGAKSSGTLADDAAVGAVAWSNPSNAGASDNTYATASVSASSSSHYLKATNFGLAIPSTATVTGIMVEVERKSDGGTRRAQDSVVKLVKGGTVQATDRKSTALWPAADAYKTYGSASDMWGTTWTPAEVNASNFGVVIGAKGTDVSAFTAYVDHIRVTVYYSYSPFGPAVNASQSIEFRWDDTIREDSTGTYWGSPQEYRGAPFFLPPAGDENRTSRLAVMMRRKDIYTVGEPNVTDNQTVEVRYTPRYLYLPR